MKKNFVKRQGVLEWIVGAFMFLVLVTLAYFTIVIGSDNLFRRTYPLDVRFSDIGSLREGDHVTVKGMVIGKISDFELKEEWVLVRCALDYDLQLRDGYRIEVYETSVLGGRQLRIHPGEPDAPPITDDHLVTGVPPVNLMVEAGKVVGMLRGALMDEGVLDQVAATVASLNQVAGRLERGEGTLGALLKDDSVYRELTGITASLDETAKRVADIVASVERGEGTLGQIIKEDGIGRELQAALENISALTAGLRAGDGVLGSLLNNESVAEDMEGIMSDAREIAARLRDGKGTLGRLLADDNALYDDIEQTMAAARNMALRIENGEGSLGQLMKDDALYRRMTALIDEIRATVDDFRESTPLTTFTSILFGAL